LNSLGFIFRLPRGSRAGQYGARQVGLRGPTRVTDLLRRRPPRGIPPRVPAGSYGPDLVARGLLAARTMRNLPTVAIGLGLLLAAILLDDRTAEDPKAETPVTDWAPSSWPPNISPPIPDWWPVGDVGMYAGIEYAYLTLRATAWRWEIDYDTGELYRFTIWSGVTHDNVLVGPGVNIGSESDSDEGDPWVTNRQTIYNIKSDGTRVDIHQYVSAYGAYIDNVSSTLTAPEWAPVSRPYEPFPVQPPTPFPGPRPVPAPLPLPAQPVPPIPAPMAPPRVAPGVPVPLPEPAQDPTVAPRPMPRPSPAPARMPRIAPLPIPGRSLLPNGSPAPEPASLPLPTPAWQEVPWPGGPSIGSPAQRPQATPEGIAAELGRLEGKLAAIGASPGLDLEAILEAIGNLIPDPPAYTYPAGAYVLEPVCECDEEGVPLPAREVTWAGGTGELSEVRKKLDAIADLLQISKELKQPVCYRKRPTGAPVTVTFEEEAA